MPRPPGQAWMWGWGVPAPSPTWSPSSAPADGSFRGWTSGAPRTPAACGDPAIAAEQAQLTRRNRPWERVALFLSPTPATDHR